MQIFKNHNKETTNIYGTYPCVDYLNNALRYLLNEEQINENAISEICHCIKKAQGEIYSDVVHKMKEKGLNFYM